MYKDYATDAMYMVNKAGDVLSKYTGLKLKPSLLANGYYHVNVRNAEGKRVPKAIHRMVAETFLSPVEGKTHVNHKDGNKLNNCIENLEWCTNAENKAHAADNALTCRGEKHPNACVTEAIVHEVCAHFQAKYTATQIIKLLGSKDIHVSRGMLYNIRARRDWTHISVEYKWAKFDTANKNRNV